MLQQQYVGADNNNRPALCVQRTGLKISHGTDVANLDFDEGEDMLVTPPPVRSSFA